MEEQSITKYDRIRGVHDVALFTRASTVKNVETITGKTETFTVETARYEDQGDYVFIECVDEKATVTRLCLPPSVANLVASQRERLTKRRRSMTSKRIAKDRMARGEVPGFMRKKGEAK